jgi:hypothetical protein
MRLNDFSFPYYYYLFSLKKEEETYTCGIKRAVKFHVVSGERSSEELAEGRETVDVETLKKKELLRSYL